MQCDKETTVAEKNFLSWVGFKGDEDPQNKGAAPSGSQGLERIRELESQLNELRARRDITALSKEEFEILATETAMSMIRTAQQREAKANSSAERILNESRKTAAAAIESAESKAKSTLSAAESRGRKYIEAAEADAADIVAKAESDAEELINTRRREANAVTANAKREAEKLVLTATTEISEYRNWLAGVISEAERLYRIQSQSLDAAENAITQSRQKLETAFNRLQELQRDVTSALRPDGTPMNDAKVASRIASSLNEANAKNEPSRSSTKKKSAPKKRR